jgi:hypothetical protein
MIRPLVIIESPYASTADHTMDDNIVYLRRCLRHSWESDELPFASHAFFPFFLNEHDPDERKAGIEAGFQFWEFQSKSRAVFPLVAFYCDLGISNGMAAALQRAQTNGTDFVIRFLDR